MRAKEILTEARELLSDPARWCKGGLAFRADGVACDARGGDAVRWCALGAMHRAAGDEERDQRTPSFAAAWEATNSAAGARGFWLISDFNNAPETEHADIMAFFDEAIAAAD